MAPAQSFISSYAPRLRQYANTLLQPAPQTQNLTVGGRTTKRGTTIINYADDAYDDDDFDDSEGNRRPTGLRSIRREDLEKKEPQTGKYGKEIHKPVNLQPIYREWMIRRHVYPMTDKESHIQAQLPLTLIPIRVDVDVDTWQPDSPYPLPPQHLQTGYNLALPMYKRPEPMPPFKIRDVFMWNLHESLVTPDKFAETFVRDLDLPMFQHRKIVEAIGTQIRSQLEDYAGIALHPLFYTQQTPKSVNEIAADVSIERQESSFANGISQPGTPRAQLGASISRPSSATPGTGPSAPATPFPQGLPNGTSVVALATPILPEPVEDGTVQEVEDPTLNPDDTYRCIITLSIYLTSKLYSDKFEWSLLHPPGVAEQFAKQTCADMGLGGEWVLAITHAIYEAVLRLKKEVCESGLMATGGWIQGHIDNQAVREEEAAGWRYDVDDFGAEWEPRLEDLSKDDIEKREYDRERQLRRLRRDAAKLTSSAGMLPSAREQEAQIRGAYFDLPGAATGGEETPLMGRGERNKKKRRFRSLSPVAKAQTPDAYSSAGAAWGGEGSKLTDNEMRHWRCRHCLVWASAVWAVRDGPYGPRTLCNNCGLLYERDKKLPVWSQGLHRTAVAVR